jgi:hypothetical protein
MLLFICMGQYGIVFDALCCVTEYVMAWYYTLLRLTMLIDSVWNTRRRKEI